MTTTKNKRRRPHLRDIRERNRVLVLCELMASSPLSRQDLSNRTGLTNPSVSRIAKELIEDGLCIEGPSYRAEIALGRKRVELRINPEGGYILGLSLSVFSRRAVITDISGVRRFETEISSQELATAKRATEFVGGWLDSLVTQHKISRSKLLGAAAVIAGTVEHQTGYLVEAPLLKWRDVPIGELLTERLQCPVVIENVADALCLSRLDHQQPAKGRPAHMLLIHIAYGMGASLVVDGKIVRRKGDESWIGRLPTENRTHPPRWLALNSVASGKAILKFLEQEKTIRPVTTNADDIAKRLSEIVGAEYHSVPAVRNLLREAGASLGRALLPVTAAYQPDVIALAGPVASSETYRQAAVEAYRDMAAELGAPQARIEYMQTGYVEAAENLGMRAHFLSLNPQRS